MRFCPTVAPTCAAANIFSQSMHPSLLSPADALRFWPSADVRIYGAMVRGLSVLLRVSDAIACVEEVARRGVPESTEVSFGQTIDCPLCRKPFAVIQPQVGRQVGEGWPLGFRGWP